MTAVATNVLDELRRRREATDFHDLARRVAFGEEVPVDQIDRACVIANETPDSFASLVDTYQSREQERQKFARTETLREEEAKLTAEIAAHNAELEAAVQEHQTKCGPIQGRLRQIRSEIQGLSNIPRQLRDSCPDNRLAARLAHLQREANAAHNATSAAERHLSSQQAALRTAAWNADRQRQRREWSPVNGSPEITVGGNWLGNHVDPQQHVDDNDPLAAYKRRVLRAAAALEECRERQRRITEESGEVFNLQFEI